ncbi:MAG: DUF2203 family protein [Methanobacteriota archaeon]|nr:MAG: DUF2203 family protein [Euryarchaeota archaeon]
MAAPFLPAGLGSVGAEALPAKTLTVEEANRLLPSIEAIFQEMDRRSIRLREVLELITDLEEYWGVRVGDLDLPDRAMHLGLLGERDDLQASLHDSIERIQASGAVLKDYQQGLVDFYGVVDGRLAFLCWQRGEPAVRFYHPLEGGFAGRRPLTSIAQK